MLPHCLASHVGLKPALAPFEGQPTSALTTSLTYPVSRARPLHKKLPQYQHMEQQHVSQCYPDLAFRLGDISTEPHFSLCSDLRATILTPQSPPFGGGVRIKESSIDQHTTSRILKQASKYAALAKLPRDVTLPCGVSRRTVGFLRRMASQLLKCRPSKTPLRGC